MLEVSVKFLKSVVTPKIGTGLKGAANTYVLWRGRLNHVDTKFVEQRAEPSFCASSHVESVASTKSCISLCFIITVIAT